MLSSSITPPLHLSSPLHFSPPPLFCLPSLSPCFSSCLLIPIFLPPSRFLRFKLLVYYLSLLFIPLLFILLLPQPISSPSPSVFSPFSFPPFQSWFLACFLSSIVSLLCLLLPPHVFSSFPLISSLYSSTCFFPVFIPPLSFISLYSRLSLSLFPLLVSTPHLLYPLFLSPLFLTLYQTT